MSVGEDDTERDDGIRAAELGRGPGRLPRGHLVGGRYRVEALLGEGGMGVVYGVRHVKTNRPLALKVLLPALASRPDLVRRFMGEARAAAEIRHPGIVEIVDMDMDRGVPFMVMEWLEGEELLTRIQRGHPLPVEFVARVGTDIAEALEAAHSHTRKIIHRDLKPQNVFLARRGKQPDVVKILDFGIAKLVETDSIEKSLTRSGEIYGSPHYMSPEQLRNPKTVDERTDIYAIGVILYQALTARTPFASDSFPDLIVKITSEAPVPLASLRPDLPVALVEVVEKAMARDRDRRYPTAAALRQALMPFAVPASVAETLPAISSQERPAVVSPLAQTTQRVTARRSPMLLVSVGLLAAGAAAAALWWRPAPPPQPRPPPVVVAAPPPAAAPAPTTAPPVQPAPIAAAVAPVAERAVRRDRTRKKAEPRPPVASAPTLAPPPPPAAAPPPDPGEHATRAERYRELGKYAKAVEEFVKAYEGSRDPDLLFQLGKTHRLAGNLSESLRRYRDYLAAAPAGPRRAQAAREILELEKLQATTPAAARPGLMAPPSWNSTAPGPR